MGTSAGSVEPTAFSAAQQHRTIKLNDGPSRPGLNIVLMVSTFSNISRTTSRPDRRHLVARLGFLIKRHADSVAGKMGWGTPPLPNPEGLCIDVVGKANENVRAPNMSQIAPSHETNQPAQSGRQQIRSAQCRERG